MRCLSVVSSDTSQDLDDEIFEPMPDDIGPDVSIDEETTNEEDINPIDAHDEVKPVQETSEIATEQELSSLRE